MQAERGQAVATAIGAGVAPSSTANAAQSQLLLGLCAGASSVVLDFFIVLACLPSIEQTLGASAGQLQLVMAAYAIANGSFVVVAGRLGDIFGRRLMFLVGLGLFALASAACGLATSAVSLIVFRIFQGVGGAILQPQALALLSVNFADANKARVFGLYAASQGFAGIVAQLVGGVLVAMLPLEMGWRACFMVVIPVCALAAYLASAAREPKGPSSAHVDIFGAVLVGGALGCLCVVLTLGRDAGWPTWTSEVLAAGFACATLLCFWLRAGHRVGAERVVPSGILRKNGFAVALLTVVAFYAGVASFYFVLALELRLNAAYTPLQVGYVFAWLGAWFVLTSSSRKVKVFLARRWDLAGVAVLAAGHVLMAFSLHALQGQGLVAGLLTGVALQGVGLGLLMGPVIANSVSRASRVHASVGGGMTSAAQQMGNSLGIAGIGFAYFQSGTSTSAGIVGATTYLLAMLVVLGILLRVRSR
jgi:MFS family permease